ncbi:MAG TPA: hypothetical protein VD908_01520 [Cytophagales bacterium]|nr:hypothetical protein [Cytophagales bacterium]
MNTFKYKTNIDDVNGVTVIRKILDNEKDVQYWYLDLLDQNHFLTVTGLGLKTDKIKKKIKEAGFELAEV